MKYKSGKVTLTSPTVDLETSNNKTPIVLSTSVETIISSSTGSTVVPPASFISNYSLNGIAFTTNDISTVNLNAFTDTSPIVQHFADVYDEETDLYTFSFTLDFLGSNFGRIDIPCLAKGPAYAPTTSDIIGDIIGVSYFTNTKTIGFSSGGNTYTITEGATDIKVSLSINSNTNEKKLYVGGELIDTKTGAYTPSFNPTYLTANAGIFCVFLALQVGNSTIRLYDAKIGDGFYTPSSEEEISPDFDIGYISIYPKVDCKLSLKMNNNYGDDIFLPANSSFSDTIHANKIKLDTISDGGDVYYYLRK